MSIMSKQIRGELECARNGSEGAIGGTINL